MKKKKILLISLITITTSICVALSSELLSAQAKVSDTSQAKPIIDEISNNKGDKATVYTSSATSQTYNKMGKAYVATSFIEDPSNSNLTALITLKGFIPGGLKKKGEYSWGKMNWARKYSVSAEISDENDEVKILESIPRNTIETVNVSENIGYSIGGNLSADTGSGKGGVDTGFNMSRSISYSQPDFKTTQTEDELKKSTWDIEFVASKDGYDVNSYHGIYGNQLFMKSRLYNTGLTNLLDNKDLSPLIAGGFTPNMVLAIKAPKDINTKTTLKLTYTRYMNEYSIDWYYASGWFGQNKSSDSPLKEEHTFTIDWKEHTVKKSSI